MGKIQKKAISIFKETIQIFQQKRPKTNEKFNSAPKKTMTLKFQIMILPFLFKHYQVSLTYYIILKTFSANE